MADDKITTLYNLSEEMTKAGDAVKEKHEEDYKTMIEYVKTSETKERILAAQLIARFFKYFPSHEESAFDSILDLCESVDVDVRKHATMAMIAICRDCKHFVSRTADILIQLYQTNQASEVNLINQSLMTLLNLDVQKFLQSFFTSFEDGTEIVRERALKFLSTKIHTVSETALTKEVEEQLLGYAKKAMEDVTEDEFHIFVGMLSKLKIAKTVTGQAMIALVIKSQAELDKEFDVNNMDLLNKFLLCTKQTIPLLSQYNRASEYIDYICTKILPQLNSLAATGNDLTILQTLAEMSPYIHADDVTEGRINLEKCQQAVFDKLQEYLPTPQQSEPAAVPTPGQTQEDKPADEEKPQLETQGGDLSTTDTKSKVVESGAKSDETNGASNTAEGDACKTESEKVEATTEDAPAQDENAEAAANTATTAVESTESQAKKQEDNFLFTHIEYLIYTLHQFGRIRPEFFTDELHNSIHKQLYNLALGCKKYGGMLSAQLRDVKSGEDLKSEENKLRSVALRTIKNISTIVVKDLLKKPPQFKTTVLLSCKPLAARPNETTSPSSNTAAATTTVGNNNKYQHNKGQQNNGNYNKGGFNRQGGGGGGGGGQKHKYRQSYQNDRNKRPRHSR